MDRIHMIFFALGSFVEFSNTGSTKLSCAFDVDVIYQTRERVFHQDIQTPRSGLKKRGAAEFF